MKITFIDLRPYGYICKKLEWGYVYPPYMPFTHETEEELQQVLENLEKEYKEKLKGV